MMGVPQKKRMLRREQAEQRETQYSVDAEVRVSRQMERRTMNAGMHLQFRTLGKARKWIFQGARPC